MVANRASRVRPTAPSAAAGGTCPNSSTSAAHDSLSKPADRSTPPSSVTTSPFTDHEYRNRPSPVPAAPGPSSATRALARSSREFEPPSRADRARLVPSRGWDSRVRALPTFPPRTSRGCRAPSRRSHSPTPPRSVPAFASPNHRTRRRLLQARVELEIVRHRRSPPARLGLPPRARRPHWITSRFCYPYRPPSADIRPCPLDAGPTRIPANTPFLRLYRVSPGRLRSERSQVQILPGASENTLQTGRFRPHRASVVGRRTPRSCRGCPWLSQSPRRSPAPAAAPARHRGAPSGARRQPA